MTDRIRNTNSTDIKKKGGGDLSSYLYKEYVLF